MNAFECFCRKTLILLICFVDWARKSLWKTNSTSFLNWIKDYIRTRNDDLLPQMKVKLVVVILEAFVREQTYAILCRNDRLSYFFVLLVVLSRQRHVLRSSQISSLFWTVNRRKFWVQWYYCVETLNRISESRNGYLDGLKFKQK